MGFYGGFQDFLMRKSTSYRGSWIQTGWESISNTRSLTRDMPRNMMNGCSGTTSWRIWVKSCWKNVRPTSTNAIPLQRGTWMSLGQGLKGNNLYGKNSKKTCSET